MSETALREKLVWRGGWIRHPYEANGVNEFVYFRKVFEIREKKTARFFLYITAEREYCCWLNGKFAGRGPVLCDPQFKRYDVYDISSSLLEGKNVLAAAVYRDSGMPLTPHSEYGGLLCQIASPKDGGGKVVVSSDGTFKTWRSTAYSTIGGSGDVQSVMHKSILGVTFNDSFWPEFYDAGEDPAGWQGKKFDDSRWMNASFAVSDRCRKFWGYHNSRSRFTPWVHLIPRDIPHLRFSKVRPAAFTCGEVVQRREPDAKDTAERMSLEEIGRFEKTSVINPENLVSGKGDIIIENSDLDEPEETFDGIRNASVLLDFGEIVNGRPCFRIACERGAVLDIGYGTSLQGGRLIPYISSRTKNADQYVSREGLQDWSAFNWRHFRYIQITFRNLSRELKIKKFFVEKQEYSFDFKGDFSSGGGILDKAFLMGRRTLNLCASDRFMDNPSREAKQYLGDVSSVIPATLNLCGVDPIVKKYFRQFDESPHPTGLYRGVTPAEETPLSLLDHALYFPFRLWEYYYYSGDGELVRELWPNLLKFTGFLETCINRRGLLEDIPYPVWIDWADVDIKGEILPLNALYAEVLRRMGDLAEELNLPGNTRKWGSMRGKIRERIVNEFFDPARGVFADCIAGGRRGGHTSEQGNSAAMLFGGASEKQKKMVVNAYRKTPRLFGKSSPIWQFWPPALAEAGEMDMALEWIESRFGRLIREGFSTIPETWCLYGEKTNGVWRPRNSRAECQSGGVWINTFLIRDVAGISPFRPGFAEVLLKPRPGKLKWVKAAVPAGGKNKVELSVKQNREGWDIEFSLPSARQVFLDLPVGFGAVVKTGGIEFRRNAEGFFDLGKQKKNRFFAERKARGKK